MLDREYGKIVFECDECGAAYHTDSRDFDDAWSDAKDDGWLAYKEGGSWCHSCPDCA